MMQIPLQVNGESVEVEADPRDLLIDVLRDKLALTGTHAACEQGACGACTVLMDGQAIRSCLMFAVQASGHEVRTIEGIGAPGSLHPLQAALSEHYGLQCGFCTPGVVMTAIELLETIDEPSRPEIERWMSGSLCRCTGYASIVAGIEAAANAAG